MVEVASIKRTYLLLSMEYSLKCSLFILCLPQGESYMWKTLENEPDGFPLRALWVIFGSPDEYRRLFSMGPKKTSYPCKTERQVWDDTEAVHIRTASTWSKNKKYSWHDQKLFGLLCLYHPSVEMTRRAVAATPPESWTAIISKTYVIRCI